tara:strand:+ start:1891 stop:2145 length:255 start_codon:yes stop_codon:yes gene_type:complete
VVKERINEVIEFANSQSPYKSANRGWINDFIFFQLLPKEANTEKEGDEFVKVSVKRSNFFSSILFVLAFLPTISILAIFTLVIN